MTSAIIAAMINAKITPALKAPSTKPQPESENDKVKRIITIGNFLIDCLLKQQADQHNGLLFIQTTPAALNRQNTRTRRKAIALPANRP